MAVAGVLSLSMDVAPFLLVWAVGAVAALVLAPTLARRPAPRPHDRAPEPSSSPRGRRGWGHRDRARRHRAGQRHLHAGPGRRHRPLAHLPGPAARSRTRYRWPVGCRTRRSGPTIRHDAVQPGRPNRGRASFGYFGFSDRARHRDPGPARRHPGHAGAGRRARLLARPDVRHLERPGLEASRDPAPSRCRGGQPIRLPARTDDGPPFATVPSDELVQTYYVERAGPNMIFAAATPTKLYFEDRTIFQLPDGSLRAGVELDEDSVYTVVSQRRLATAAALRASTGRRVAAGASRELYARAPVATERVRALAASGHRERADRLRQGPRARSVDGRAHRVHARHPAAAQGPRTRSTSSSSSTDAGSASRSAPASS